MRKEKPEAWEATGPAQDGLYNIHSEDWIQALRDAYKDKEPGAVISNPPWLICRCSKANAPLLAAAPEMLELINHISSMPRQCGPITEGTPGGPCGTCSICRARALIAKIEEV